MAHLEECEATNEASATAMSTAIEASQTPGVQDITPVEARSFSPGNDRWQRFAAGGLSGMLEVCISHPLDLLKTLVQHEHEAGRPASPVRILGDVVRREGLGGLYRGMGVRMLGLAPMRTVFWGSQSLCNAKLKGVDIPEVLKLAIVGACAGTAQTLIDNPVEVLKIRAMVHAGAHEGPLGTVAAATAVANAAGATLTASATTGTATAPAAPRPAAPVPMSLFNGFSATLSRNVTFAVLFACGLYGGRTNDRSEPLTTLFRGAAAGFTASVATQWLDYCKTVMQTPGAERETIRGILSRTPVQRLWVGALPRASLSMVTMSVGAVCFSTLERLLIEATERRRR